MSLSPQFGSIVPSQIQQPLANNYLAFNGGANDFAQQYLPEIYEQEVERYGNRTLSGFLRMVGAEMPMTSDQVIWSEQNRLHVAYNGITATAAGGVGVNPTTLTITDGSTNVMSVNDTIVVLDPASGLEAKCIVLQTNGDVNGNVVVQCFAPVTALVGAGGQGFSAAAGALKIFVYGSAYTKGTNLSGASAGTNSAVRQSITPSFTQFSNSPLILRDQFQINGSDMAQIGWVEVATEDGASGYLWYLKLLKMVLLDIYGI